jgi:hypothetical protein
MKLHFSQHSINTFFLITKTKLDHQDAVHSMSFILNFTVNLAQALDWATNGHK